MRCKPLFSLLLGSLLTMSSVASAKVYDPKIFTLDNGMTVALVENHRIPAVMHMVWYKVGAVDEPLGKSGIAHFLEHLMFKGTEKIPPQEFSKIIARKGGEDNAFTSWDYTAYFQKISRDNLPMVMEMEADRMRNLVLSEKDVTTERGVIVEERSERVDSNPIGLLEEQLGGALFQHQPYRIPVIGWRHEMEGLQRQDAFDFYQRFYAPSNAILVVSGAVTLPELKELAEKTYGALPTLPVPTRIMPKEPPTISGKKIEFTSDKAQMPLQRLAWLAPSYATATESTTIYALKVLEQYMAGSGASVLYKELVLKQKIASDVGMSYEPERRGEGVVSISVIPVDSKPQTFEKTERAVLSVLKAVQQGTIDTEAFARAKKSLAAGAVYSRDSLGTPAMVVGEALVLGIPIAEVEEWPVRIQTVTPKQMQEAAQRLDTHTMASARLFPKNPSASGASLADVASGGAVH
jgi:zinc protease